MADIDILVDSSQVKTAKQELQELSNSFNSAFKSASVFTQAFRKAAAQSAADARVFRDIARANQDIINANLKVSNSYKSAEASAEAFTKGLREQEAQALRTARANQEAINKQLGVSGPTAMGSGAGFGALESEMERLRQKYDQMYSASKLYETSLAELNRAHMLGVTSTKQHEAALESLNLEYQNFQNGDAQAGNRFAQYSAQSASRMNQFGVVTQQAGYQIGDFLVQVQSGTNWMVAFGQQATQLVGVLPLMGAGFMGLSTGALVALSAGLGIAIPLVTALGAAFMRTSEQSKEGASGLDKYQQILSTLRSTLDETTFKLEALRRGVAPDELFKARLAVEALNEEFLKLTTTEGVAENDPWGLSDRLREITETRNALQKTLETLQKAADEQQRVETAATRRANEQRNAYREAKAEADRWKTSLEAVRSVLDSMNGMVVSVTLDLKSTASGWASQFLSQLTTGFENKRKYIEAVGGGRGLNMGGPELDPYGFRDQLRRDQNNAPTVGSSGGGGGGGAGDARIISLIESLQTEREVIEEWYAESQTILQTASDAELAIIGGRNEARLRLEQEYQEKLRGIRNAGNAGALGDAEIFFQGMADIAAAGGDRTVKAMRIFSAAQALINSYVAFTEVLKDPSFIGRPWARFGAAASALSSGLAAVAAIKGGGGGSISRGSATVASPSAAAPSPQTVYIDSLEPDSLYSGQTLINLFDAFYNENDKRGKVFVVAR